MKEISDEIVDKGISEFRISDPTISEGSFHRSQRLVPRWHHIRNFEPVEKNHLMTSYVFYNGISRAFLASIALIELSLIKIPVLPLLSVDPLSSVIMFT
jgi:hypothetical protein